MTRKIAIPSLLGLLFCAVTALTLRDYGIVWDEPVYVSSTISYATWFKHPRFSLIDKYWEPTHEHPPMGRLPGAFTWALLHRKLGVAFMTAIRSQQLLWVFILTFSLYSLVREVSGAATAAAAATLAFLLPRVFADAHLYVLDYPMSAAWTLTAWMFLKGLRDLRWMIASAISLGLALLIKLNGFFLYALIIAWFIFHFRKELWRLAGRPGMARARECPPAAWGIACLVLLPPLIFVLGWPWLWPDPAARIHDYLRWHFEHFIVPVYYLGATSTAPPWHYPFVLTALTTPLVILIPMLYGLVRLPFGPMRAARLFILANAAVPILAIAFLATHKYDGVRLWLPAFPFLCAIAALGLSDLCAHIRARRGKVALVAGYAALLAVTAWFSLVRYHPYQSAYYNELIGGARGAAARGFESDYWGGAYQGVIPWLNTHPGARVWTPINRDSLTMYRELGFLDKSFRFAERAESDYLLLDIRQGCFDEELWRYYRDETPLFSVKARGAPLVSIYEVVRPGPK